MKIEKSCGAIVYKLTDDRRYYLLVQQKEGFWSFPKGHIEEGESEEKCSEREVEEETGLILLPFKEGFREVDEHPIPNTDRIKRIVYFLAEALYIDDFFTQEPRFQEEELLDARFVTLQEAKELLTRESSLALLQKAEDYLDAEEKDEAFCRGADPVLAEAKDIAVSKGMKSLLSDENSQSGRVLLGKDGWLLDCTNARHEIIISVSPQDITSDEHSIEVAEYYASIIKKHPEADFSLTIGNGYSLLLDRPGISVSVAYGEVYPTAEEILSAAEDLTDKIKVYGPVVRAIAAGQPVPEDNSEASKLYYEVFLKSEQYEKISEVISDERDGWN